ncbi:MAG TPA: heme ABC exporter ATP-binding protein CcmA [Chakrabartia sp.]|nr:heme ABC exporter ATP-binding protein CcmA [Chakrabartia sp.]
MAGAGQLVLRDCALERGGRQLFSGLSFTLDAGEAALVTGPNGAGKSSLTRMIAGLLPVAEGQMRVTGRLALSNESLALDSAQPLGAALAFWAELDGQGADAVATALEVLAIPHLAPVPVRMLSTGQRKRASLARVMASGADIWLLDEPANGLDTASIPLLEAAMAAHRTAGGIVLAVSPQPLVLPDAQQVRIGA